MKIDQWKRLEEAPAKGQLLAYTREMVVFEKYNSHEAVKLLLADKDIVEIHLFDRDSEYRGIISESPRSEAGIIECVERFPDEDESVYKEELLLENGKGSLIVLNHIQYDEIPIG